MSKLPVISRLWPQELAFKPSYQTSLKLVGFHKNTLPETKSSTLKINGWSRGISFWDGPVAGVKMLVSGSVVVASDQQSVVYPTKKY